MSSPAILHVVSSIDLGGAENHLFDLAVGQKKLGHRVVVAYLRGSHHLKSKYQEQGIETIHLDIQKYYFFYKAFTLWRLIKKLNIDIVHAHMPPAELYTRLALLADPKIPFVISKHNDEPFSPYTGNWILPTWVARRAQRIICISDAVKKYVQAWLPENLHHRLLRIYYAVDVERFSQAKPASDLQMENSFVIGTVARLTAQKSLHTLLQAFSDFMKLSPSARLVIVGVGPLETNLKNLAQELNIQKNVHWAGTRHDIPNVMKSLNVFVLPSIYEGFGLVLLEAMAAKVPVIASAVSAIPEVLDEGRCGLLFPAGDAKALLDCFIQIQDQNLQRKLVLNGTERVQNFFSQKSMCEATELAYK